jgi:hypothetical protein
VGALGKFSRKLKYYAIIGIDISYIFLMIYDKANKSLRLISLWIRPEDIPVF